MPRLKSFRLHGEMEITGELYYRLRSAGLNVKLEVRVPSYVHKSGHMRIDIGIVKNDCLVAAIECKRNGKKLSMHGRQSRAYRELRDLFGVHVIFLNDAGEIDATVRSVLNLA